MALHPTRRDRWLALGLLLGVAAALYLLLVHPLLTQPLRALDADIASLQERGQRIDAQLKQAPQVAQRLQQAQQVLAAQPGFMSAGSAELATAQLVQRLEETVREASPGNRSCAISDRSPLPADTGGRFVRVAMRARLRCGMSEWMNVLQSLESGSPQLRVDHLDILAGADKENIGLDVSFELSGYLRPGAVAGTPEVANAQ